jgi:hypothetical protein
MRDATTRKATAALILGFVLGPILALTQPAAAFSPARAPESNGPHFAHRFPSAPASRTGPQLAPLTAPPCVSAWYSATSPNQGSAHNLLTAVAPISAGDAWAVGIYAGPITNGVDKTMAVHWDGSTWSLSGSQPGNLGTSDNDLNAVAAVSSSNVWAVGDYNNGAGLWQTMIQQWDGTTWSVKPSPNLPSGSNFLFGATATGPSDVWAVGYYYPLAGGPRSTLIEHWDGTSWSKVASPNLPSASNSLFAVSASSPTDVWAVGRSLGSIGRTLVEHYDGSAWRIVPSPNAGSGANDLFSVSVLSSNVAWAVGDWVSPVTGHASTLVEQWDGNAWSIVPSPNVNYAGLPDSYFFSVAATSPTSAWAVGASYSPSTATTPPTTAQLLTAHWNGSAWSIPPELQTSGWNEFNGVAMTAPGTVWAVGDFVDNIGTLETLTENLCVPVPSIESENPGGGPIAGGTQVTLIGHGFRFASAVNFGSVPATSFTWDPYDPDRFIKAIAPPEAAGTVPVTVVNDAGVSQPVGYTFYRRPVVTGVSPGRAPEIGGKSITITGNDLRGATLVTFGEVGLLYFGVNADGSITVDSPPHCIGTVDVTVTTPGGTSAVGPADLFSFDGDLCSKASTNQYMLPNSDGATWAEIDPDLLSVTLTPTSDTRALVSGNADLWTLTAGYNQDLGITVNGSLVAWKESGGFAGTFSPNAAFVQTVVPMTTGVTYRVALVWKTNKPAPGITIAAGAGPIPGYYPQWTFSPTRLGMSLFPATGASLATTVSTSQYVLPNSDGKTWTDLDPGQLSLTYMAPADGTAILGGNADLWTSTAGFNQDIGIAVDGSVVAWKESGGSGGTFSPNAAYVLGAYHMKSGTTYTVRLQWKANKDTGGATVAAGAGPIPAGSSTYSPTRLTILFYPATTPAVMKEMVSTLQYSLTDSDGTWQRLDPTRLTLTTNVATNTPCFLLVRANADLWTSTSGYNQDLAIFVGGNLVAWKESGGFAGTYSPNAAFVEGAFLFPPGQYTDVTLWWKANRDARGATIWAGAGPISGQFSPTRLTVELIGCT